MKYCENCGDLLFNKFGGESRECKCQPFLIIDEEGEEHTVNALDAKDAALVFARKSNEEGDNYLLLCKHVNITVNGKSFRITAEPDVQYAAKAL